MPQFVHHLCAPEWGYSQDYSGCFAHGTMWDAKELGAYSCVEEWPRLSEKRSLKKQCGCRTRNAKARAKVDGAWIDALLQRQRPMIVAVAVANKLARIIWAMMISGEMFRERDPLMRPDPRTPSGPATIVSVASKGRVHERTGMMTQTCRKPLAPAAPSIHEAFNEAVPDRLARRSGLGDRHRPIRKGWSGIFGV